MTIENLIKDLNLDQNVIKTLQNSEIKDYKTLASKYSMKYDDDSYILSGRLLMEYNLSRISKDTKTYADILSHRFSKDYYNDLLKYSDEIDSWFNKIHCNSFSFIKDYISASKWLGSNLMDLGFGSGGIEYPEFLNIRVAWQLYHQDSIEKILEKATEMQLQYYTHASPTLFNSGTDIPQLGSCFLLTIYDDSNSLQEANRRMATISKFNGGLGLDYSRIRASTIGYSGKSKGAISQGQIADSIMGCWDQGGRRTGAATSFLRDWHYNAWELCEVVTSDCDPENRFKNTQACIWISDLFLKRVKENGNWTFFCPKHASKLQDSYNEDFETEYLKYEAKAHQLESEFTCLKEKLSKDPLNLSLKKEIIMFEKYKYILHRTVRASEFMDHIVNCQLRDGPYIMNGDSINFKNQMANIGPINCSNLCTEIVQPTSETEIPTCNLASLNMTKFVIKNVKDWENVTMEELRECYDFELMGKMVRSMVENINRVIDSNYYPLDEIIDSKIVPGLISQTNMRNRPMGLGVSGMYNALMKLEIPFDSNSAKLFNKMFFACMYYNSLLESHSLAVKDGEYPTFRTGEWKRYNPETQDYTIVPGSPLSNGFFQFDLWKLEEQYHRNRKTLVEFDDFDRPVYQSKELIVINPEEWGQEGTWNDLCQKIMKDGVRNSMLLAPMPTASTANIMSNVEAFEAPVGLIYTKKIKDTTSGYAVPEFINAMKDPRVIWNQDVIDFIIASQGSIKHLDIFYERFYPNENIDYTFVYKLQRLFKTAYEISQRDTVRMVQERGIYVCQSQSFNIFLAQPSSEQMIGVLTFGANLRLKTMIYYLRQANPNPTFPLGIKSEIIDLVEDLREDDAVEKVIYKRERPECISCSV